ncbi:hypothetical protein BP6252_13137 [Coleophoma cylindrospora]|uniref:Nephrocystin 3-like N-terminal domain-containing protein n=1 Tax=Coleophoma cylindrospora TaxID=1849047 RepID=A0A3D8QA65_9HELO|nr:hypothetical protein BP6252_13137 [Coleophoma cylindrospora]
MAGRNQRVLGLQQVFPSDNAIGNTTIDIIAIHGLETGSPRTWEYWKEGASRRVNWISDADMMPAAVPEARIYTYDWDANCFDDAPVHTLLGHANDLLVCIARQRESQDRPMIFVASCFGGLILAEAICRAGQEGNPYRHVMLATVGAIFLATPFSGSTAVSQAKWFITVKGILGAQSSDQLIRDLEARHDFVLQRVHKFAEIANADSVRLPIRCFFEMKNTVLLRNLLSPFLADMFSKFSSHTYKILVAESSACLPGFPRQGLHTTHSGMNKFSGPEDPNYKLVKDSIKNLVQGASTVLTRRKPGKPTFPVYIDISNFDIHKKFVFDKLRSAGGAAYDSHDEEHNARCYQGTRVELLRQIDAWASDKDSECIFWLNGMAGTGKSTISRSVAQIFAKKGVLGASFFFKRGEGDRGHAGLFIPTIATQLVKKLPSLALYIQDMIEAEPTISSSALRQQFETLIIQPLGKIQPDRQITIIIVVDALDECEREEDIKTIIRILSQVKPITSVQLKFFLTSRPELPIRLGFQDINGRYKGLALHQIPESVVKEDICAFLEHTLAIIRNDYNKSVTSNRQLSNDWPDRSSIQILVKMAIPLFIFATTICRFINDRRIGQPKAQLAKVLKYETKSQASKLDATYGPVLDQLLIGVTSSERQSIVEGFQQVVGSIVMLASPLPATSLDLLLGVPEGTVNDRTDLLHSVLNIPSNPDHPIRLLHLSFRDFLVDVEKRETNPFWIKEKDVHAKLAINCLQRLSTSKYLKKDICNIQTPERPRVDMDHETISLHLPPDIQYACQYWVYHLKEGESIIYDDDKIHNFLKSHFLHWLEALSLIGRLRESISTIDTLVTMVHSTNATQLSRFLHDAKRFVLNCCSIAESSPLQLYSSALIFAPKHSIIRSLFQFYIPDWISLQPNTDLEWNAVLQTLEGHGDRVWSVAFSHDSKLLASASFDKTVKVWDAATGTLQQTLEGHGDETLEGHGDRVWSVAFSHDSKLLASASSDETVKVWDAATGTLQQTIEVDHWVTRLSFDTTDSMLITNAGY